MPLLLVLWLISIPTMAQTACAVFNSETKVLTFKGTPDPVLGDNETMVATFYPDIEKWVDGKRDYYGWPDDVKNATKVVIEESFKDFAVPTCQNMFFFFRYLTSIEGLKYLNTAKAKNMRAMFSYCWELNSLDLSGFNTAQVEDMSNMFQNCTALNSLDLSSFNTAKVTDMSMMFINCNKITSLDLSGFNTALVTNMKEMFHDCTQLTLLDLSSFSTGQVTDMEMMFWLCSKITSLDLSGFNTGKVKSMKYMFLACSKLANIYASDLFTTENVESDDTMFGSCSKLPNFNWEEIGKSHAHYRQGGYFQRLVGQLNKEGIGAQGDDQLVVSKKMVLSDDDDLTVFVPFTASSISHARAFTNDEWQAVYVPFPLDVDGILENYELAAINNFHEYEQTDGSWHLELEVKRITGGTISAYTPLLIRRKEGDRGQTTLTISADNVAIVADEGNVIDCASISREYKFTGTTKTLDALNGATDYLMQGGELQQATASAVLPPYRWYLTATDIAGSPTTPAARADRITIKIVGNSTTAIAEALADDHQPQGIYDLQGRRLAQEPQHGVYIKNGRKYVK